MDFSTRCVHTKTRFKDPVGSIEVPLYLTTAFQHGGVGISNGYDYTRLQNPTREALEDTVRDLEQGHDCLAFSSGMAAISCLFELFKPGDRIVSSWDLYGGTIRLFDGVNRKNNLIIDTVDTTNIDEVRQALRATDNTPAAAALFVESPTNPLMDVSDLAALSEAAHEVGALVIVDNTFLTPYFCKPLTLGADVVVHSGTKYLSGHHDSISGFIVSGREDISEQLRYLIKTIGSGLSPFDSYLVQRGLKTLPLRMDRHQDSALKIAEWLQQQPQVTRVVYPGLKDSPARELCLKQGSGFGGMITFYVDTPERAESLLKSTKLIIFAESLGGAESLITYPLTQTHADVSPDELAAKGIDDTMIRLSVGLENADDLIADLAQALGY